MIHPLCQIVVTDDFGYVSSVGLHGETEHNGVKIVAFRPVGVVCLRELSTPVAAKIVEDYIDSIVAELMGAVVERFTLLAEPLGVNNH